MAEQWLSIVEYARTFAVSDMTVRRRIKTGRLRAVLREGKYYIPLSAIDQAGEDRELSRAEMMEEVAVPVPIIAAAPPAAAFKNPIPPAYPALEERSEPSARLGASFKTLPVQIAQSVQKSDHSLVDSQALLQYCEQSITRINSIERHLQESYQLRLQNVETQLKIKDGLIAQLKQQVEDLQMLVKLMEQNPKALQASPPRY